MTNHYFLAYYRPAHALHRSGYPVVGQYINNDIWRCVIGGWNHAVNCTYRYLTQDYTIILNATSLYVLKSQYPEYFL